MKAAFPRVALAVLGGLVSLAAVATGVAVPACSTSSSTNVGDAGLEAAPQNQCTAYGQGYVCQPGPSCSAGYVNKEDYFCGSSGNLCCGPVGEGGLDASDDVNVFVDGAVFETGPRDAAADAGHHDAAAHDAGGGRGDAAPHDATTDGTHPEDAGRDAPLHHDAALDALPHDAKAGDAKPGDATEGDARAGDAKPGDAKHG